MSLEIRKWMIFGSGSLAAYGITDLPKVSGLILLIFGMALFVTAEYFESRAEKGDSRA